MQKNLNLSERLLRIVLAGFLFFAATILFENPIARVFAALFGFYSLWEAAAGKCPLHARLGVHNLNDSLDTAAIGTMSLVGIQAVVAYEWWHAGWEKLSNPEFLTGMGKTLGYFASKNPFPWYAAFLTGPASDHSMLFGAIVAWVEAAVGVAMFVAGAGIIWAKSPRLRAAAYLASMFALLGGIFLNANFYFAAAWTGAGTKGVNVTMFWTQIFLAYAWLKLLAKRPITDASKATL